MRSVQKLLSVLLAVLICALCAVPAFAEDADPAACEHEWDWVIDVEPTCMPGKKHMACALCGNTKFMDTQVDPVLDHNWVWVTDTEATCQPGTKHAYCARCGSLASGNTPIEPAYDHAWGEAEYIAPSGCVDGCYRYTCAECGQTKETLVPATGDHNWEWVVDMPPTRYDVGRQHEHCTVCGANRNLNTPIPSTEGGADFGTAITDWIDSIGNFFHNIIVQIMAFFNNARA